MRFSYSVITIADKDRAERSRMPEASPPHRPAPLGIDIRPTLGDHPVMDSGATSGARHSRTVDRLTPRAESSGWLS